MEQKECTRCNGTVIITDQETGEDICSSCGLVINNNNINMEPEWKAFTFSESNARSRIGGAASYAVYDKGLSTFFGGNRDATGKTLNVETLHTMMRLRRYDSRSKVNESWRRNLSIAMAELDRMSDELHLPNNIKELSAVLYRKTLKIDLVKGRSIDAFVAACIYAVCRQSGLPRPLKEIAISSKREHSEVAKYYRLLLTKLKLKMPIDGPTKFIPKIASILSVSVETECRSIEIIRTARRLNGLSGKNPMGIAAAGVYMACQERDEKRAQREVAQAAGTSEVTLRKRVKDLELLFT